MKKTATGVLQTRGGSPGSGTRPFPGLPHELQGNAIHAYVILKVGEKVHDGLVEELRKHVAHEIGPIARPEKIEIVDSLPKTRSGKIMRRVLKARALGQDPGNLATLEE